MSYIDESGIKDFWENKNLYKKNGMLLERAKEFYSNEFINEYSKWKENLEGINQIIKDYLFQRNFPQRCWEDMKYDWFAKKVIDLIEEWIKVNEDITPNDIRIITEKLIQDYINIMLHNYMEHANSINGLMESIKKVVVM